MQEEMQNIGRFHRLSRILLSARYSQYLDKPLAFWMLPTDRRLPLCFLSRSLGDLVNASYEDLAKTPGIGSKKMGSLICLLNRAVETASESGTATELVAGSGIESKGSSAESRPVQTANGQPVGEASAVGEFDPLTISEVKWSPWRECVMKHGLGGEKLGRFAPSLQRVTRVIWNTPIRDFAGATLAELRAMKSYGEKRVETILEIFYGLYEVLSGLGNQPHLTVRIAPASIDRIEQWVGRMLQTPGIPVEEEILEQFIRPLLAQIEIDAMPQIVTLAEHRLGIFGAPCSVRQSARNMGLTRARVYQLLNEINDIANVRWPLGRHQVHELRQKFERESPRMDSPPDLTRFHAALELIFPGNRRGADGPLDSIADDFEEEESELVEVG
jgi:hypothetical protein